MKKENRHTVIGKTALVIAAASQETMAAQVFNYDHIREIRLDLKELEVKLLTTYDEAYYKVFEVKAGNDEESRKKASNNVLRFYNDLLNATMKLTKEELENMKKQKEAFEAKAKESKEASKETKKTSKEK